MTHPVHTDAEFEAHLKDAHHKSTFSAYLKEIVFGGTDGIVTTFAVVAGFTGAQSSDTMVSMSVLTVLLFGLANLFADGAAMGLGNFLSLRAEKQIYTRASDKEWQEIHKDVETEKSETRYLLQKKGFSPEDAHTMTDLMVKNKPYWHQFMMTHELELDTPEDNPALNGLATFCSFLFFGSIPILPYFFMTEAHNSWLFSSSATLFALVLLGTFSGIVTGRRIGAAVLETVLVGGTAASIAYFVGSLF